MAKAKGKDQARIHVEGEMGNAGSDGGASRGTKRTGRTDRRE